MKVFVVVKLSDTRHSGGGQTVEIESVHFDVPLQLEDKKWCSNLLCVGDRRHVDVEYRVEERELVGGFSDGEFDEMICALGHELDWNDPGEQRAELIHLLLEKLEAMR